MKNRPILKMGQKLARLWNNPDFLKIFLQIIFLIAILFCFGLFFNNLVNNFQRLGLKFGFGFLFDGDRPASFSIGDSAIPYQSTDPYIRAILVGLVNSFRITISGILFATMVGVTVGISRLSSNWLVRKLATLYVEVLRNTPLLLQLFFWYFVVFLNLPKIENPFILFDQIFISNQGIFLPFPKNSVLSWILLLFLLIIFAVGLLTKKIQNFRWRRATPLNRVLGISIFVATILIILVGFSWQQPNYDRLSQSISGGLRLSPEFATLLVGLSLYTAAFIAEVVRAAIQSVPKGQLDAATALGLKDFQIMRLIIFPQALRVMIPPLTSEFLNLAKNSSLAIAIGFSDIYAISQTISNQTGRAIEMLLVVMIYFLCFNLVISAIMNTFNRMVKIQEN